MLLFVVIQFSEVEISVQLNSQGKNLYFQIVIKTKISFSNMGYLLWQKHYLPRIFEHLRCIHTYLYQLSTPSFVFVRYHWSIVWMIDECCVCCATSHGKNDEYDNHFFFEKYWLVQDHFPLQQPKAQNVKNSAEPSPIQVNVLSNNLVAVEIDQWCLSGNACCASLLWRLNGCLWCWWLCPPTSAWTGVNRMSSTSMLLWSIIS